MKRAVSIEKTILIIEDEETIRQSFSDYLEDLDFRTVVAENGRIGVEIFDPEKVDLVSVDLRMPEMDGLEVLAHIREKSPDTPLIVVSGTGVIADEELINKLQKALADETTYFFHEPAFTAFRCGFLCKAGGLR